MQNPETCLKYLCPGRLVRVVEGGSGDCKGQCENPVYKHATRHRTLDWGWGVVVVPFWMLMRWVPFSLFRI